MSGRGRQGLIEKQVLTNTELTEIKQLIALCDAYDGLYTRYNERDLRSRPGIEVNDFLYYSDDVLSGYLALENWGTDEKELMVGVVHPERRLQGIFTLLLRSACEEIAKRGAQKLVLVCNQASASGMACMQALGIQYTFSEHEMVLKAFHERFAFDERLSFQEAGERDKDRIVAVQVGSFDGEEEAVRQRVTKLLQDPSCYFYLTTFGEASLGCREPVGVLRLHELSDAIGIYGFGILPDYRGRGYGRQMLEEAIRTIRARSQKPIMLDVDVTNRRAIGLYESCGFIIKTTYDYYTIALPGAR